MSKFDEAGKTTNQVKNDKPVYAEPSEKLADLPVDESPDEVVDAEWLAMARDAYRTSESYFDSSIRANIERNLSHFAGRHAPGSKYYSDAYKFRAKGFRPKTRSVIRRSEAKAAIALFSTSDSVIVEAENVEDEAHKVSAEINQELLNYRLKNTVGWYQKAMGAFQDAQVVGVCISHNYWEFEEIEIDVPENSLYNEMGEPASVTQRFTVKDTPAIDLRPIENVRFSPDCSWDDPVGTSAYIIDEIPIQVGDLKSLSNREEKTALEWILPTDGQLLAGGLSHDYNAIRQQREGKREDSKDQSHIVHDFDVAWVHRNIIKKDGIDWLFFTLGETQMLTNVIPLAIEYPHLKPGQRPYTWGTSILETHKAYPESQASLVSGLQQEANEVSNQRRDNVQLAMNRRYFARRGANINYRNLGRSVPGAVVEMDNIQNDIRSEAPPDVTGSSYQEQERINLDFDELAGNFSQSSVGTNRHLAETVGGMELMSSDSDDVTEYSLKTFAETWAKNTLKQLVQLEQYFETDEALLSMVGGKIELWQRYNVNQITDAMLQGNMNAEIKMGFGSTNPTRRVDKLLKGVSSVLQLSPEMQLRLDVEEVSEEIFGALGFASSKRFFKSADEVQPQEPQPDPRVQVEAMRLEDRQAERQFKAELADLMQQYTQINKEMDQQFNAAMKQFDAENTLMIEQGRAELSAGQLQVKVMEIREKIEADSKNKLDAIKAKLAETTMKLQSTERLVDKKATADQLPKPPVEPPGRAPAGQSYSR